MEGFLKSITPDRLVDLCIAGDSSDPVTFRVSAQVLSSISEALTSDLESAQRKAETKSVGEGLQLAYPEDKPSTWRLLLFWAYSKHLPTAGEHQVDIFDLVDAWILGDQLMIPAFQDEVMLRLLQWHECIDADTLTHIYHTLTPGTEVACFIAEEIVYLLSLAGVSKTDIDDMYEEGMRYDEIEHLVTETPGTLELLVAMETSSECIKAGNRYKHYRWELFDRYRRGRTQGRQWWMEFMVSPGRKSGESDLDQENPKLESLRAETLAEEVNGFCEKENMSATYESQDSSEEGEDGVSAAEEGERPERVQDERNADERCEDARRKFPRNEAELISKIVEILKTGRQARA